MARTNNSEEGITIKRGDNESITEFKFRLGHMLCQQKPADPSEYNQQQGRWISEDTYRMWPLELKDSDRNLKRVA